MFSRRHDMGTQSCVIYTWYDSLTRFISIGGFLRLEEALKITCNTREAETNSERQHYLGGDDKINNKERVFSVASKSQKIAMFRNLQ